MRAGVLIGLRSWNRWLAAAFGAIVAAMAPAWTIAAEQDHRRACPFADDRVPPPSASLRVTFYGVSTLLFDDGRDQLLVDGFFSRPGPLRTLFTPIGASKKRLSQFLEAQDMRRVRAILTAHAHHDHVLDAPAIASVTKSVIVGSRSATNLGEGAGLDDTQLCAVQDGDRLFVGAYEITAFETPHGDTGRFLGWLLTGDTSSKLRLPAWFVRMKDRQNFSYLVRHGGNMILVHPSAGFRSGLYLDQKGQTLMADLAFIGIGGLKGNKQTIADYWAAVPGKVGAKVVVPVHWDRFTRPLNRPLVPIPKPFDDVEQSLIEIQAIARPARIVTLNAFEGLEILPDGKITKINARSTSVTP